MFPLLTPHITNPDPCTQIVRMCPDLVMGSLIKNAGGTLAPGGGYVAGRADLVSAVGARLAAPGIGTDAGGVPGTTLRLLFQGEPPIMLEAVRLRFAVTATVTRSAPVP